MTLERPPTVTRFAALVLISLSALFLTLVVSRIPAVHDGRLMPVFVFAIAQGCLILLSGAGILLGTVGCAISFVLGQRNRPRGR